MLYSERTPGQRVWTTAGVPEAEQFDYWRDVMVQAFARVRPTREGRGPFRGTVRSQRFGAGQVSHIETQPVQVCRSWQEISRSPTNAYFLLLQISGLAHTSQCNREGTVDPGEFVMLDPMAPFDLRWPLESHQVCFQIPRALIERYVTRPHALTAVPVRAHDRTVGALVAGFLRDLATFPLSLSGSEDALLEHLGGLVGLALRATSQGSQAGMVGRRATLLSAALRHIAAQLDNPALSPSLVASQLSISKRYLHDLFTEHDTTVERCIMEWRLRHAYTLLSKSIRNEVTIAEVCITCGLSDLSHFSRAFRRRYGKTPSEVLRTPPVS